MAKTLVIKGANYSDNKLDTVSWGESIPCTAIALNKSTTDIKYGNTETLVATPTPSNTTDSVSWASSDTSVATVANGVVTVVGVGTATITVTCGSQNDSCVVTATADMNTENVYKLPEYRLAGAQASTGGNGVGNLSSSSVRGIMFSTTGSYVMQGDLAASYNAHPYKMPNNTTHVKITVPSGVTVYRVGWWNDASYVDYSGGQYAKLIGMDESFTPVNNVVQIAVPSYDGFPEIDSIVVSFQNGQSTFTSSVFENISVEFLHIDPN